MDPALSVKWQQNLQFSATAFLRCAAECTQQEISMPASNKFFSAVSTQ